VANLETKPVVGVSLVHDVVFYRGSEQLERLARDFVSDGVAAGEPVLVAMPPTSLERVSAVLDGPPDLLSFEDLAAAGRNPAQILPLFQDWADAHDGRVRVLGEPAWPSRSRAELVECLRHESLVNIALARFEMTMLCPYDADGLDEEVLAWAEATHPRVVDLDGTHADSASYRDPPEFHLADRWPLEEPPGDAARRSVDGDLRALRQFVTADERAARLGDIRSRQFLLAVHEAASNALMHGDGTCEVTIWRDRSDVVCEVRSEGWFDDPLAGRMRPDTDAVSGRGLWLINQLCDLVEVRSAEPTTTVRMHMREDG
jgi:anti-sigma regulatory factor (Ser/Thr protein kinase)